MELTLATEALELPVPLALVKLPEPLPLLEVLVLELLFGIAGEVMDATVIEPDLDDDELELEMLPPGSRVTGVELVSVYRKSANEAHKQGPIDTHLSGRTAGTTYSNTSSSWC